MNKIVFSMNNENIAEENLHKIILIYEELVIHIHENGNIQEASKLFAENYFNLLIIIFKNFFDEKNIK
jgi:hypothetical protein